jgi:hypothetical protein
MLSCPLRGGSGAPVGTAIGGTTLVDGYRDTQTLVIAFASSNLHAGGTFNVLVRNSIEVCS